MSQDAHARATPVENGQLSADYSEFKEEHGNRKMPNLDLTHFRGRKIGIGDFLGPEPTFWGLHNYGGL